MADSEVSIGLKTDELSQGVNKGVKDIDRLGNVILDLAANIKLLADAEKARARAAKAAAEGTNSEAAASERAIRGIVAYARAEASLGVAQLKTAEAAKKLKSDTQGLDQANIHVIRSNTQLFNTYSKLEREQIANARAAANLAAAQGNHAARVEALRRLLNLLTADSAAYLRIQREIILAEQQAARGGGRRPPGGGGGGGDGRGGDGGINNFGRSVRQIGSDIVAVYIIFRSIKATIELAIAPLSALAAEGIKFNTQIEQAQIGISGLYAQLGTFRNAQGFELTGVNEFRAALQLAKEDVLALQIAGLKTSATTKELVEAFQVSLGAGLGAGLGREQIRSITVDIVQAARAIGLPLAQLSQEVRAIFEGTIDRNARVANVLGITTANINNWKQMGTLAKELEIRLSAFRQIGPLVEQSFEGATSNLLEFFQTLSAIASQPLFETIRDKIAGINKSVINSSATGGGSLLDVLTPDAKIVATSLREIFDGIAAATGGVLDALVAKFKEFGTALRENQPLVNEIGLVFVSLGLVIQDLIKNADIATWLKTAANAAFGAGLAFTLFIDTMRALYHAIAGVLNVGALLLTVLTGVGALIYGLATRDWALLNAAVDSSIDLLGDILGNMAGFGIATNSTVSATGKFITALDDSSAGIRQQAIELERTTKALEGYGVAQFNAARAEAAAGALKNASRTVGFLEDQKRELEARRAPRGRTVSSEEARAAGEQLRDVNARLAYAREQEAKIKDEVDNRSAAAIKKKLPIPGLATQEAANNIRAQLAAAKDLAEFDKVAGDIRKQTPGIDKGKEFDAFLIEQRKDTARRLEVTRRAAEEIKKQKAQRGELLTDAQARDAAGADELLRLRGLAGTQFTPDPRDPKDKKGAGGRKGGAGSGSSGLSESRALIRERLQAEEDVSVQLERIARKTADIRLDILAEEQAAGLRSTRDVGEQRLKIEAELAAKRAENEKFQAKQAVNALGETLETALAAAGKIKGGGKLSASIKGFLDGAFKDFETGIKSGGLLDDTEKAFEAAVALLRVGDDIDSSSVIRALREVVKALGAARQAKLDEVRANRELNSSLAQLGQSQEEYARGARFVADSSKRSASLEQEAQEIALRALEYRFNRGDVLAREFYADQEKLRRDNAEREVGLARQAFVDSIGSNRQRLEGLSKQGGIFKTLLGDGGEAGLRDSLGTLEQVEEAIRRTVKIIDGTGDVAPRFEFEAGAEGANALAAALQVLISAERKLKEVQDEQGRNVAALKAETILRGDLTRLAAIELEIAQRTFDIERDVARGRISQGEAQDRLIRLEASQRNARIGELEKRARAIQAEGKSYAEYLDILEQIRREQEKIAAITGQESFLVGLRDQAESILDKFEQLGRDLRNVLRDSILTGFQEGARQGFAALLQGIADILASRAADALTEVIINAITQAVSKSQKNGGILGKIADIFIGIFGKIFGAGGTQLPNPQPGNPPLQIPGRPPGTYGGPIPGAPNPGPAPDPRGITVETLEDRAREAEKVAIARRTSTEVGRIEVNTERIISLLEQMVQCCHGQQEAANQGPSFWGELLGGIAKSIGNISPTGINGGVGFGGGGGGLGGLGESEYPVISFPDDPGFGLAGVASGGGALRRAERGLTGVGGTTPIINVTVVANNPAEFLAQATQDQMRAAMSQAIPRTERLSGAIN